MSSRHSTRLLVSTAFLAALAAASPFASAGVTIEKVASTGDPAPGTACTYSNFFAPFIGYDGQIGYQTYLKQGAANIGTAAYLGSPASSTMLAIGGQPAPGTGANFGGYLPYIYDAGAGNALFADSLSTSISSRAIFFGAPGSATAVAVTGQQAPGVPAGNTFSDLNIAPAICGSQILISAALNGSTDNSTATDAGYWAGTLGNLQLLARLGSAAPGTASTFAGLASTKINANGLATFYGNLATTPQLGTPYAVAGIDSSGGFEGLWAGTPGNVQLIARAGNPTPASAALPAGSTFGIFISGGTALNNAGQMAFPSMLTIPGSTGTPTGLWFRDPATGIALVAKTGDTVPGLVDGTQFDNVTSSPPEINHSGAMVFGASLTGPTVTGNNNRALIDGTPGHLQMILRTGDAVPGIPGATFVTLDHFAINDSGDVLIQAFFSGVPSNNYGVFLYRPGVGLSEVLRAGDAITLGPGDTRTMTMNPGGYVYMSPITNSGTEDGRDSGFNNADQFPLQLWFTDGSTAIVRATALANIPEPATLGLLALSSLCLLRRRR